MHRSRSRWCRNIFYKMIIPNDIEVPIIALKDQYFDLRGLSAYSSMAVPTLRDYIKTGDLPCYKIRGKLLIKKSEFDKWVEGYRHIKNQDLNAIVDGVIESLQS